MGKKIAEESLETFSKPEPLITPDTVLEPGDTLNSLKERLGPLEKKLEPVSDLIVEDYSYYTYICIFSSCNGCS